MKRAEAKTVKTNKPNQVPMKTRSQRGIALIAIAGMALAVHAQDVVDQSQYPTIVQQPVDACLPIGAAATFSVQATNVTAYQWLFNGNSLDGQTNNSLTILNVNVANVGFYSVAVMNGSEIVPSRSALLNVYTSSSSSSTSLSASPVRSLSMMAGGAVAPLDMNGGGTITVFGMPVTMSGGNGNCPGKYSGYVNYTKTVSQGWGWVPMTNTTVYTASDLNQSNTKVQYVGGYGDIACGLSSVTIPSPTMSPAYRFSIYFPPGSQVPTNAYPITLSGFNP
jgi:hypothetical protein